MFSFSPTLSYHISKSTKLILLELYYHHHYLQFPARPLLGTGLYRSRVIISIQERKLSKITSNYNPKRHERPGRTLPWDFIILLMLLHKCASHPRLHLKEISFINSINNIIRVQFNNLRCILQGDFSSVGGRVLWVALMRMMGGSWCRVQSVISKAQLGRRRHPHWRI